MTPQAIDAILELEDAHEAWGDTDAARDAHDAIRGMVTRFGTSMAARTLDDETLAEVAEVLGAVRERARSEGRWDDADAVRLALLRLSVEVRDTPAGTVFRRLDDD